MLPYTCALHGTRPASEAILNRHESEDILVREALVHNHLVDVVERRDLHIWASSCLSIPFFRVTRKPW